MGGAGRAGMGRGLARWDVPGGVAKHEEVIWETGRGCDRAGCEGEGGALALFTLNKFNFKRMKTP